MPSISNAEINSPRNLEKLRGRGLFRARAMPLHCVEYVDVNTFSERSNLNSQVPTISVSCPGYPEIYSHPLYYLQIWQVAQNPQGAEFCPAGRRSPPKSM